MRFMKRLLLAFLFGAIGFLVIAAFIGSMSDDDSPSTMSEE